MLFDDGITIAESPDFVVLSKKKMTTVRVINFVEPFIVMGLILLTIWTSNLKAVWMYPVFAIIILWILVVSPILHY